MGKVLCLNYDSVILLVILNTEGVKMLLSCISINEGAHLLNANTVYGFSLKWQSKMLKSK